MSDVERIAELRRLLAELSERHHSAYREEAQPILEELHRLHQQDGNYDIWNCRAVNVGRNHLYWDGTVLRLSDEDAPLHEAHYGGRFTDHVVSGSDSRGGRYPSAEEMVDADAPTPPALPR